MDGRPSQKRKSPGRWKAVALAICSGVSLVTGVLAVVIAVRALAQQEYVIIPDGDGAVVRSGDVTIAGMQVRRYSSCVVHLAGPIQTESSTLPATYKKGALPDGRYEVEIRIYDRPYYAWQSLMQAISYELVVDNTSPTLRIERPSRGEVVSERIPFLIHADGGYLSSVLVDGRISALAEPAPGLIAFLDPRDLGEGTHYLEAIARDAAGNSSVQTRSFVIDTEAPILRGVGLADGATVGGVVGFAPDTSDSSTLAYSLLVDGDRVSTLQSGSMVFWDTSAVRDGRHRVRLEALDQIGRITPSELLHVVVDNTEPQVQWMLSSERTIKQSRFLPLPVLARCFFDEGATDFTYLLDGIQVKGPFVSFGGTEPGTEHTVTLVCSDLAGNEVKRTAEVEVADGPGYVCATAARLVFQPIAFGATVAAETVLGFVGEWMYGVSEGLAIGQSMELALGTGPSVPTSWTRISIELLPTPLFWGVYVMIAQSGLAAGITGPLETGLLGTPVVVDGQDGLHARLGPSVDLRAFISWATTDSQGDSKQGCYGTALDVTTGFSEAFRLGDLVSRPVSAFS